MPTPPLTVAPLVGGGVLSGDDPHHRPPASCAWGVFYSFVRGRQFGGYVAVGGAVPYIKPMGPHKL